MFTPAVKLDITIWGLMRIDLFCSRPRVDIRGTAFHSHRGLLLDFKFCQISRNHMIIIVKKLYIR